MRLVAPAEYSSAEAGTHDGGRGMGPRSSRVRVTLLGPLPPSRAISAYTAALVAALGTRTDVDLDVLTFRSLYPPFLYPGGDQVDRSAPEFRPPAGVRVTHGLRWWNPFGWIASGLFLRGDVVHAQWWTYALAPMYIAVLALARLRRKRVVLTVHNVRPHEAGRVRAFLHRCVFPLAHLVIVHSEANRAQMQEHVRVPIRVVPHGSLSLRDDLAEFVRAERQAARARFGLGAESDVVLLFGHLRRYKGIEVLVEAFALVREHCPQAQLLIVGEPWEPWEPYQARLRALGLEEATTVRLGFASDAVLADALAAADVVAFPYTHFDGQSGAASLALSAGLPIVVSRVGGLPDLVQDSAAVVEAGSSVDLGRALTRILSDKGTQERLRRGALEKASEIGWESVAEATAKVYADVCPR